LATRLRTRGRPRCAARRVHANKREKTERKETHTLIRGRNICVNKVRRVKVCCKTALLFQQCSTPVELLCPS